MENNNTFEMTKDESRLTYSFLFDEPRLSNKQVDAHLFTDITMDGTFSIGRDPGVPIFQVRPVQLLIPQGTQVVNINIETKECRKFKEDIQRLKGNSKSSLIYRVPKQITGWKIYSFTQSFNQNLKVSLSKNGKRFEDFNCKITSIYETEDYYDYWRPVLYEAEQEISKAYFLKITLLKKILAQVSGLMINLK